MRVSARAGTAPIAAESPGATVVSIKATPAACALCKHVTRTNDEDGFCKRCQEPRYEDDFGARFFVATFSDGAALEWIAEYLGVTRERVRQIEEVALKKFLAKSVAEGLSREDLAAFISQRVERPRHPLASPRYTAYRDHAAENRKRTDAVIKARASGAPAPDLRNPGNATQAINRLPPSDTSVQMGAIAERIKGEGDRIAARVEAVGPVLDALCEWMATAEIEP